MNFSCATYWHPSGQSFVTNVTADISNLCDISLSGKLTEIEGLIREGYVGEARFAIRKMMEAQLAIPEEKNPGVFYAHQILGKIHQKLLMSSSLENLGDITILMEEIRGLYGLPGLSVHATEKTKNVPHLFPNANLRNWFRVSK